MTQILVTKPETLTAGDKRKLRAAGVVTVEADNPGDVRLIQTEGPDLGGDDLLFAAITAIANGGINATDIQKAFPVIVAKLLQERRTGNKE